MNKRRYSLWLVTLLIYAVFFAWYSKLGGPLPAEEIDYFIARIEQGGAGSQSAR